MVHRQTTWKDDDINMHPLIAAAGLLGIGALVADALTGNPEPTTSELFDCSFELSTYYNEQVRLPDSEQARLRAHRDANRERLKKALAAQGGPSPVDFIPQGSHAMNTINRALDNDYDIDDGVVFEADDLVGPRGAPLSSLAARKFVRDCLQHGALSAPPELKRNCVRVNYAGGYHVDIPVYRRTQTNEGHYLEHAGKDWEVANPREINLWFSDSVSENSPDETQGQQLRRIVRLLKAIAASRSSWNMPSGFIISVLAIESYVPVEDRDDASLYLTMRAIAKRLRTSLEVEHPVLENVNLTLRKRDASMVQYHTKLNEFLERLKCLHTNGCQAQQALAAWSFVFNAKLRES